MKPQQSTLGEDYERHTDAKESDIYYTPGDAINSLLDGDRAPPKHLPVVEPAAGRGDIVRALAARGYTIAAMIEIRKEEELALMQASMDGSLWIGDFLKAQHFLEERSIVTNPPFSLGSQFWLKAHSSAPDYIAFLLRLNTLGSRTWMDAWNLYPPTFIRSLAVRPSFTKTGRGTDAAEYAWIGWERGAPPIDFRMV